MIETSYQIKVYNNANTVLKQTISPKIIASTIGFTSNLNWWQGEQKIDLQVPITNTDYSLWDLVKISVFNENNKDGYLLYSWYISKIEREQTISKQSITLTCLWVASLLTEVKGAISFNGASSWVYVKNLIDSYNAEYGNIFTYTLDSIEDWIDITAWSINWTYLEMLSNLAQRNSFNLFIGAWWLVYFKSKDVTPTHYITNQKNIDNINIEEDMEWLVNSVKVTGKYQVVIGTGESAYTVNRYIYTEYEDDTSISIYWKKQVSVEIQCDSLTYLEWYAEKYVNDRKDPKRQTVISLNNQYNIDSIKPWDTIKIKNFDFTLSNVKIVKTSYTPEKIILYLDEYISFGGEILWK